MTGVFWLDWAALAVSLFDTMLCLWLGLTVLLNAERRRPAIWLAGGGLLLGAGFFVSHTAILGQNLNPLSPGLDFWWHLGWIPAIVLPYSWYGVTLWYAGFWQVTSSLYRRQRIGFAVASILTSALGAFLILGNPLPSFAEVANLQLDGMPLFGGAPVLLVAYIADIFICMLLSLDALRHPVPSLRVMGNIARERARPWLTAAGLVLLLVGLLVAGVVVEVTVVARQGRQDASWIILMAGFMDLIIAALIALTILLVGQAVARYEVFTGKALPRRGLLRDWRNAVVLASGYSIAIAWSLTLQLRPVYILLLATALLTLFYALLSWRTLGERDRSMRQLRPFVTSQKLFDRLLNSPDTPAEVDIAGLFRALVQLLGSRTARLVAVGPLAPLVPPLSYPTESNLPLISPAMLAQLESPQTLYLSLAPEQDGSAQCAVPLWSERGLSGVLLLGPKNDEGLYSQEEIELARASGERLLDTAASAAMAQRLMAWQRERTTETQLLDQRPRRVLHDEVLPQIHAAILNLSNSPENNQPVEQLIALHRQISNLLHDMPSTDRWDVARLGLVPALEQAMQEWARAFDCITWEIAPDAQGRLAALPGPTAETLYHAAREAVRNAARYARGDDSTRSLHLCLRAKCDAQGALEFFIADDGIGLDAHSSGQGSGQGLALHSAMLAVIGGTLSIEPRVEGGTCVVLRVP